MEKRTQLKTTHPPLLPVFSFIRMITRQTASATSVTTELDRLSRQSLALGLGAAELISELMITAAESKETRVNSICRSECMKLRDVPRLVAMKIVRN
jgi:hypothetical protein